MPDIAIRAAARRDLAALAVLEAAAFASDRLSARSFSHLVGSASAACRLAFAGKLLAGYHIVLFRANARVARLYSLAVAPAARGRGVAATLLADAERLSLRRGCRSLRLEVRADNRAAIRLYEGRGYRPIGRYPRYYADKADAIRYEKPLARRPPMPREPDEDRSPRDVSASPPPFAAALRPSPTVTDTAGAPAAMRPRHHARRPRR